MDRKGQKSIFQMTFKNPSLALRTTSEVSFIKISIAKPEAIFYFVIM